MRALTTILLSVTLTTAPAWASGSDDPTPYTLTPAGITFPTPLAAHGHVNIRLTDGTARGLHLDPNNGHPGARWIGETFLPWTALDVTSGCIAWVQWSGTNEHYGEGGQPPVCVPSEEPSWPTPTVPTSTEPSTPSPTTPTAPSPTTPPTTPAGDDSTPTSEPSTPQSPTSSPSPSSTPTPSSTPSTTPSAAPSPEATTTPQTPTETPWTTPSLQASTPSTQPTSAPSPEAPSGSDDPPTPAPTTGAGAVTSSPYAYESDELPVTGPSGALIAFAGALTFAGLGAVALGRRTR